MLAIGVGNQSLPAPQTLADSPPTGQAVLTATLGLPRQRHPASALAQHPDFLKPEHQFHPRGRGCEPWPSRADGSGPVRRAVATAAFGVRRVRISHAGCMNVREYGPAMVICPDGT